MGVENVINATVMTHSTKHELIKTDTQGRKFVKAEHREAILDAFEATSMSGLAFAKEHGINYSTFQHWVRSVLYA